VNWDKNLIGAILLLAYSLSLNAQMHLVGDIFSCYATNIIYGEKGDNGINRPLLIEDQHGSIELLSYPDKDVVLNFPNCSNIISSKTGEYIISAEPSVPDQCYSTPKLSIFHFGNFVKTLDLPVKRDNDDKLEFNFPIFVDETNPGIITFKDNKTLCRYNLEGEQIFAYALKRGTRTKLRKTYCADNGNIYLVFNNNIETINGSGNLLWIKNGRYSTRLVYASARDEIFIGDMTNQEGLFVRNDGDVSLRLSSLMPTTNLDINILPDEIICKGSLVDIESDVTTMQVTQLYEFRYRINPTYTSSSNGEYLGYFGSRVVNDGNQNDKYIVKVVDRYDEFVGQVYFDYPARMSGLRVLSFQVANDGSEVHLAILNTSYNQVFVV